MLNAQFKYVNSLVCGPLGVLKTQGAFSHFHFVKLALRGNEAVIVLQQQQHLVIHRFPVGAFVFLYIRVILSLLLSKPEHIFLFNF